MVLENISMFTSGFQNTGPLKVHKAIRNGPCLVFSHIKLLNWFQQVVLRIKNTIQFKNCTDHCSIRRENLREYRSNWVIVKVNLLAKVDTIQFEKAHA